MAATKTKVADKQELCKKLITALRKRYPHPASPPSLPVLETMLFAVCLENATVEKAQAAYQRLLQAFHDLNEIRVSSLDEIEPLLNDLGDADWRAMRFRGILQFVFELGFSFELESLKKKTLELATKQLQKIRVLTPFIRNYTLAMSLGAHLLPLDDRMYAVVKYLDLQGEQSGSEAASESLRSFVRKSEGTEFSLLLRSMSQEPETQSIVAIASQALPAEGATLPPANVRLDKLLKGEGVKWDIPPKKPGAAAPAKKGGKVEAKVDEKPAAPAKAASTSKSATKEAPAKAVAKKAEPKVEAKPAAKPAKPAEPKSAAKATKAPAKPAAKPAKSADKKPAPAAPKAASKPAKPASKPAAGKPAPKPVKSGSKPAPKKGAKPGK